MYWVLGEDKELFGMVALRQAQGEMVALRQAQGEMAGWKKILLFFMESGDFCDYNNRSIC